MRQKSDDFSALTESLTICWPPRDRSIILNIVRDWYVFAGGAIRAGVYLFVRMVVDHGQTCNVSEKMS